MKITEQGKKRADHLIENLHELRPVVVTFQEWPQILNEILALTFKKQNRSDFTDSIGNFMANIFVGFLHYQSKKGRFQKTRTLCIDCTRFALMRAVVCGVILLNSSVFSRLRRSTAQSPRTCSERLRGQPKNADSTAMSGCEIMELERVV